jgi:hypothetical protein
VQAYFKEDISEQFMKIKKCNFKTKSKSILFVKFQARYLKEIYRFKSQSTANSVKSYFKEDTPEWFMKNQTQLSAISTPIQFKFGQAHFKEDTSEQFSAVQCSFKTHSIQILSVSLRTVWANQFQKMA